MTDQWKKEYTEIIEKHDKMVKSGELKLRDFESSKDLLNFLKK